MKEFNIDIPNSELILNDFYLVQCPHFCESGFEIALWNGKCFISQGNGMPINNFVLAFMPIEDLESIPN